MEVVMSITKINKRVVCFIWVLAVTLLFTAGCTMNETRPDGDLVSQPDVVASAESSVELISVVGMGEAILIEASDSFRYTSFMLTDPPRIFIDLPAVNIDKVQNLIDLKNEYITSVTASSYGEVGEMIGRIEIELKEGVAYEVKSGEDSLLVEFRFVMGGGEVEDVAQSDGSVVSAWDLGSVSDEVAVEDGVGVESSDFESDVQESSMEAATTIVDLKFSSEGDSTVVRIITDGDVGNYNSFGLDDPTRVVVDIWGVDSSLYEKTIDVDSDILERIRLGAHDDKVRFVFDSSNETVPYYSVAKDERTLVVTMSLQPIEEPPVGEEQMAAVSDSSDWNLPLEEEVSDTAEEVVEEVAEEVVEETYVERGGEEEEEPMPLVAQVPVEVAVDDTTDEDMDVVDDIDIIDTSSALEEAADIDAFEFKPFAPEPFEETREIVRKESVDVQDVKFRLMGDVARLSIVNSDTARFRIKESDDGKVINIDIFNAFIPDKLMSTLDASALGSPVATISSYQAHTEPVGNVRIIVKLNERVPYDILRDGNVINVDFPLMSWVQKDKVESEGTEKAIIDDDVLGIEDEKADDFSRKYTGRRINIDMVDAEVTDMLKLLAEVSDLNIIASDEVKGSITLRLKDVPWDQAFDLILKIKGLGSIQDGNVVRVAPVARIREERESVLAAKKAAMKLEELSTEYIRINYDKAASLSTQLETLLSDRGSITVHEPTNTIVVRDVRAAIKDIRGYINKVDIPIQQVLIEARIVEATSSFARDLGVQWGVDFRNTGNNFTTSSFGSVADQFGQWSPQPSQQTGTLTGGGTYNVDKENFTADAGVTNYAVNLPATGTAGTLGALGFILGKTGANPMILDLRISAGEQKGLVKTISRPRIITMDNKEAKIEQGESIPFETSTVDGSATTFIDANLSLIVKPQITPDGSVLMEIKASRNSIGSFRNSAGEPSINRKEASTHVLVRNGETTVMGGIIVSDTNNSEKGIPFFKDVPVLGWLFKSKSITDTQTELLIFITPTILTRDDGGS
jgi:type IV pilus assembly protein PilQ